MFKSSAELSKANQGCGQGHQISLGADRVQGVGSRSDYFGMKVQSLSVLGSL